MDATEAEAVRQLRQERDAAIAALARVQVTADRLESDGFVGLSAVLQGAIQGPVEWAIENEN